MIESYSVNFCCYYNLTLDYFTASVVRVPRIQFSQVQQASGKKFALIHMSIDCGGVIEEICLPRNTKN